MKLPTEPNGLMMEHLLAYLLGLELVTDQRQFTHDADLEHAESGRLYSVKFQKRAAQTGNLSFETALINTATGEQMPGNFISNKTERYLVVVPFDTAAHYTAYEFDTKELHDFVMNPCATWRKVRLTGAVKGTNAGRKFDDAENLLVPMHKLAPLVENSHLFSYKTVLENPRVIEYLKSTGFGKRKR